MSDKLKVVFAPGAFDNFEGTQEELEKLLKEIHDTFASGDFVSEPLDLDALQEEDPVEYERLIKQLDHLGADRNIEAIKKKPRRLN